jgi:hypothetical protein
MATPFVGIGGGIDSPIARRYALIYAAYTSANEFQKAYEDAYIKYHTHEKAMSQSNQSTPFSHIDAHISRLRVWVQNAWLSY